MDARRWILPLRAVGGEGEEQCDLLFTRFTLLFDKRIIFSFCSCRWHRNIPPGKPAQLIRRNLFLLKLCGLVFFIDMALNADW